MFIGISLKFFCSSLLTEIAIERCTQVSPDGLVIGIFMFAVWSYFLPGAVDIYSGPLKEPFLVAVTVVSAPLMLLLKVCATKGRQRSKWWD